MARKVLIVRPGAMGDVCMAVPFAAALARRCEVHWLVHRIYEPIPRGFGIACHRVPLDPPPGHAGAQPCPRSLALIASLRRERFDAVLDLAHWPRTSQLVLELSEVPVRAITDDRDQDARLGVNPRRLDLYAPFNVRVPVRSGDHQVAKWGMLARRALGLDLSLDWPLPERRALGRELCVFVHPHASKAEKSWPGARFAEVLGELQRDRPVSCLINSGSCRELPAAGALWLRLRARGMRARIVWMDRSCQRLRGALEAADLALGCDSGPMHFAALVGTPSVVVFGPHVPEEFGPLWRSIPVAPSFAGMPARGVSAGPVLRACRRIVDGQAVFAARTLRGAA